jgi:eukaryotic-like serine/threonine-protein kinase
LAAAGGDAYNLRSPRSDAQAGRTTPLAGRPKGEYQVSPPDFIAKEPQPTRYRFGEFLLDLEGGFLRRNGEEVSLRPKAFDVLRYVVLHHGRLISKDELARAVWPDVAVTDNSLAQCLLEIRRALADDDQRLIRTVARRGYVFDGSVAVAVSAARHLPERGVPPTAAPVPLHLLHRTAPRAGRTAVWLAVTVLVALAATVSGWRALRSNRRPSGDETPVQLTDFNDSAIAPSLSHDGRVLTFIRGGSFGKAGAPSGQVYVKLLDGGAPVQLTRDSMDKIHPVFSPDDSRIVYTTLLSGLRWDSWQVPVLGGTPKPFLPNASGLEWLDRRRLVYSTIRTGIHMGIATSTESRSEYREIYFPDRLDAMAHRSAPSPDGKWLLVVEMAAGTWLPCRLVAVDGSSPSATVSPAGAQCTSAAWSPDGRWMYFSSNAGGAFHVWRQRFAGGVPEQITFGPTEQEGTAITPDGRHLITSMGLQQASIWRHDATGERKLTDEGFAAQPTLSASAARMFYLVRTPRSRGESSGELWRLDLQSGERQQILPGLVLANYSVSGDERSVVYSPSGEGSLDGIWIADIEPREPPRQLVHGAGLRAFFGARGEIIYTGEDRRLYRMNADGSGTQRISSEPVAYLVSVSPDGRWAQAILPRPSNRVGTTSLWFVSLRGEQSFEVCNEACSVGPRSFLITAPFAWSRDAKWLFVNLWHFGNNAMRTVVLPYRADGAPAILWPAGLTSEDSVTRNPGARVIKTASIAAAAGTDDYLFEKTSTESNLYRLRIPD